MRGFVKSVPLARRVVSLLLAGLVPCVTASADQNTSASAPISGSAPASSGLFAMASATVPVEQPRLAKVIDPVPVALTSMAAMASRTNPSDADNATGLDAGTTADRSHIVLTFRQMGAPRMQPIRGPGEEAGVTMLLRADQIVNAAVLHLVYRYSSAALANASSLRVDVNGERVATVPLSRDQVGLLVERDIPLNPSVFVEANRIAVRLDSAAMATCEAIDANAKIDVAVDGSSTVEYRASQLAVANDVTRLPMPFFDHNDVRRLRLPFVFATRPDTSTLEAAGIVASWLGSVASYRGAEFPASWDGVPATGDAVVLTLDGAEVDAPFVTVETNPHDPGGKLLVIHGRNASDLKLAASALALGRLDAHGRVTPETQTLLNEPRIPYDAPRWIPANRPATLREIAADSNLSVSGHDPDLIRVALRLPPDVFAWGHRGVPMDLKWRYTPRPFLSRSTLDVSINDDHVETLPMPRSVLRALDGAFTAVIGSDDTGATGATGTPSARAQTENRVYLPAERLRSNAELRFQFRYAYVSGESCSGGASGGVAGTTSGDADGGSGAGSGNNNGINNLAGAGTNEGLTGSADVGGDIDPSSTIDVSSFPHYLKMPDLAAFANSGFPFTRLADLSQTAVVLPAESTNDEVGLYLDAMGRMSASTGYPVTGVRVVTGDDVDNLSGRDVVLIGTLDDQPLAARWIGSLGMLEAVPRVRETPGLAALAGGLGWIRERLGGQGQVSELDPAHRDADDASLVAGFELPGQPGRSVVALMIGRHAKVADLANALLDSTLLQRVQGGLTIVRGDRITAYRPRYTYALGSLPWPVRMQWLLSSRPFGLAGIAVIASLLLSVLWFGALGRIARKRLNHA